MGNNDLNNYLKAIKGCTKNNKKVVLIQSKRKIAWNEQGGKCICCKKNLNPIYSRYSEDPLTKKMKITCSNCAIKSPTKRN